MAAATSQPFTFAGFDGWSLDKRRRLTRRMAQSGEGRAGRAVPGSPLKATPSGPLMAWISKSRASRGQHGGPSCRSGQRLG